MSKIKLKNKLKILLKSFKIKSGDNLIIHSNSAGLFQFSNSRNYSIIDNFIKIILKKIGPKGTLLIPVYNYQFTQKRKYSINYPSEVGKIGNYLLKNNIKNRTHEPIFNHIVFGKLKKKFFEAELFDCFGLNSSYDLMKKYNFKIICFCCTPNNITFLHYIEQMCKVSYRYRKKFKGFLVKKNNKKEKITLEYYVGKKSIDYSIKNKNFDQFIKKNIILKSNFGYFSNYMISAQKLFMIISQKINIKEKFLIE